MANTSNGIKVGLDRKSLTLYLRITLIVKTENGLEITFSLVVVLKRLAISVYSMMSTINSN
jgi:hypothetical protein